MVTRGAESEVKVAVCLVEAGASWPRFSNRGSWRGNLSSRANGATMHGSSSLDGLLRGDVWGLKQARRDVSAGKRQAQAAGCVKTLRPICQIRSGTTGSYWWLLACCRVLAAGVGEALTLQCRAGMMKSWGCGKLLGRGHHWVVQLQQELEGSTAGCKPERTGCCAVR